MSSTVNKSAFQRPSSASGRSMTFSTSAASSSALPHQQKPQQTISNSSGNFIPPRPPTATNVVVSNNNQQASTNNNSKSPTSTSTHHLLAATSGRQRAILQQADEMRNARMHAYNQMKSNIKQLEEGLQRVETDLKGDFDSSDKKSHRLFQVDQIMSRRDAIREILDATAKIASIKPPGLESSSSSSSIDDENGEKEKEDDNETGKKHRNNNTNKAHRKYYDDDYDGSSENKRTPAQPVLVPSVQTKAADGVDVTVVASAVKAVNKAERKIPASQHHQQQRHGSVSFSSAGHRQAAQQKRTIGSGEGAFNVTLSGTATDAAKFIEELNLSQIRNETSYAVLPQGIDLEREGSTSSDEDDNGAGSKKNRDNNHVGIKHDGDDDDEESDEDNKDIDGMTEEQVKARFTQNVQDALDFFSVSIERVQEDVSDKLLDPPLRVETAQGKFFTIGRQYADIASRMIKTIDACRMISERSLKMLQPVLAKTENQTATKIASMICDSNPAAAATLAAVGLNTSHLLQFAEQQQQQQGGKHKRSYSPSSTEKSKYHDFDFGIFKSDAGDDAGNNNNTDTDSSRPTFWSFSGNNNNNNKKGKNNNTAASATILDPRLAEELAKQVEAEKDRFNNFRSMAKQLVSIIGGLNRCDLDARDLLDDLSQRDTLMAAERAKMNVAKEEATSVTVMRDELKSELWLHRASNKMRQAIKRKAERLREKKAAQALLLGSLAGHDPEQSGVGGEQSAENIEKRKVAEEKRKREELEKLARNPIPPGVGAPAVATVNGTRVLGPLTIVHVALDRYPEMWASAPAAATKTIQMYREAIHASLWYAARLSVDTSKLRAYQEGREELIKKYKDANEQFTEEDEKNVKPKTLAPAVEIFADQLQQIVRAAAPLLQATAAFGHQQEKAMSPLEWGKKYGSMRRQSAAVSPTRSGNLEDPLSGAAGYSPAAFAAQARKRGESPYQPRKTPGVFSHEPYPYRSLIGLPGGERFQQLAQNYANSHGGALFGGGGGGKDGAPSFSPSKLGAAAVAGSAQMNQTQYMNLGPPPVILLAEGDGSLPGGGDGGYVMVAFAEPTVAVKWMCGLQILLSQLSWPNGVLDAEILSDRSESGREKIFPQLSRFDDAVRERLAAAEAQANNPMANKKLAAPNEDQLEEDAAFIAFSRRFGLQQEDSGGPGSREFDAEPWKQLAILLGRQWGCGDQRYPGALFRGPLVRMGAHTGSVCYDELRQLDSAKVAPYYLDHHRNCATIPTGATPAVASWLCHQARGGEILISDALADEVNETLKREAIFHRRVPLPASARDFFVNTYASAADVAKLEVLEPVKDKKLTKSARSARRRSSISGGLDISAHVSISVNSKTAVEQVSKKDVYLSAANSPAQAQESDCAVQLFPPLLLERGLLLGTPTSASAKSSTYVARVTCYNPNWWLWLNPTPSPFIPRPGDLEIQKKRPVPVLEALGWTHAETILLQRQELYRCAKLVGGCRRIAARALRRQRQAMEVSACNEKSLMECDDRSPFVDAIGILRTANAESFAKFSLWMKRWNDAYENEIKPPSMPILPQSTPVNGGASSFRANSIAGSFRFSSFSAKSRNINDFDTANNVTPYVLSNVVLQAVVHRIQVLREEHENNTRIERENMRTYDPAHQQQPKYDRSTFATWFKKAEAEQMSSVKGFTFQLMCRVIDGLYEECFHTILEQLDISTSRLLSVPRVTASRNGDEALMIQNNINACDGNSDHLRPDQLHQRFCSEIMRCAHHLDAVFKVPVLLLPSRAVCLFAASRPHNYVLNPPSIFDWNTFSSNFVNVNYQKFITEFKACFPCAAPKINVTVSDLVGLHGGAVPRWCMHPTVWCRRKVSGMGSSFPVHVTAYPELMDALREPALIIWVQQSLLRDPRVNPAGFPIFTAETSASPTGNVASSWGSFSVNNKTPAAATTNTALHPPPVKLDATQQQAATPQVIRQQLMMNCIPKEFENAAYDLTLFDFPLHTLSAEQKDDKRCFMRWWQSVRYTATRTINYNLLEIRHPALTNRLTLSRLSSTMEFIRRKSQVPDTLDGGAGLILSGAQGIGSSFTPGLSWDQLLQPVLGLGVVFDPTKEFGVNRFAIVQPSSSTLHDRLLKDYSNPTNSIFDNQVLFSRRKRELLRVAIALRQLHEYGLFHGDLRPDNIFVEEEVGSGDVANARVRYRLGNMVLVPELVLASLTSPRPLKRKVLLSVRNARKKNNNNQNETSGEGAVEEQEDHEQQLTEQQKKEKEEFERQQKEREEQEDDDAKWGYVAPELLRYLSHGGTVAEPSPSEMDKETLTPQSLAKCDMFSFGVLLLSTMSGGYDHPFTQLLDRVDLDEEREQIEKEYAKRADETRNAALAVAREKEEQLELQKKKDVVETMTNSQYVAAAPSVSTSKAFSTSASMSTSAAAAKDPNKSFVDEFILNINDPMTTAELKAIAEEKALVLEKRMLSSTAASAYQIVHRAAESTDRLVMLGSLKWLRYAIFNSLERERAEPTNSEALAQKRRELKEDQDIMDRKQTAGFSGAQSFAFAIKRLVSRGRRGGAFKIGSQFSAEGEKAIAGLLLIDLVTKLIVADPSQRMTAAEVCDHPFFADVMISNTSSLPIPSTACTVKLEVGNNKNSNSADLGNTTASLLSSSSPPNKNLNATAAAAASHHHHHHHHSSKLAVTTNNSNVNEPHSSVVHALLTPACGGTGEGSSESSNDAAAQLRGFLKSAEQALLRLRLGNKASSYFGTSNSEDSQREIRWTISLDDALVELPTKRLQAIQPSLAEFASAQFASQHVASQSLAANVFEPDHDEDEHSMMMHGRELGMLISDSSDSDDDDHQRNNSTSKDELGGTSGVDSIGNDKKKKRPLHFDVRISPASSETMWKAWRYQRKVAVSLLETRMEAILRRAYDLREFVQQAAF